MRTYNGTKRVMRCGDQVRIPQGFLGAGYIGKLVALDGYDATIRSTDPRVLGEVSGVDRRKLEFVG